MPVKPMKIECYSQRLLNPFRGVMNVIRYQSAEAVTTDGINWEIFVSNDELRDGLDTHAHIQTSDIRYGHWTKEHGLTRGPIYPSADFKRMEEMGAVVYEALLHWHEQLPFPLRDDFELWLLDRAGEPLCLLHSVVDAADITHDIVPRWRAGYLCAEQFRPAGTEPEQAASRLDQHINALAAKPAVATWFQRRTDGSAVAITTPAQTTGTVTVLGAEQFPPFFIRERHTDPALTRLVQAFLDWQAPWLLLLHNLTQSVRYELEQQARTQALLVEQYFRLYPDVIDESFLRAARVEAMLRKSRPQEEKPDKSMSTWYLELGDWSRGK